MKALEVCRFAEISYRQLDYWTTQGYLVALGEVGSNPGSGQAREYSSEMADKARAMKCLCTLGFETWIAEKIAAYYILEGESTLYLGHGVTVTVERHDHKESVK